MAAIRETLILEDRFSAVFSSYLNLGRQIAATMTTAAGSQNAFNDAAAQSSAPLEEMARAGTHAADSVGDISDAAREMSRASGIASGAQDEMNRAIRAGSKSADELTGKLKSLVAAYVSFRGLKSAMGWVEENLNLSNIQRNAENQLRAVLANMGVQDITVPVNADVNFDTSQTMSAFDAIAQKASEIQGKGIYGDEAMIAGAGELSTYFSDANAIMSMMDTLANYTMGMTGGGAVDKNAMVDYATNIGKIMTGSYDAMTKKGFEFTDTQKAIIEGAATEAQIIAELGEEYLNMSHDMQAAAAINNVISESWGGLYEAMSDTPEGKIIQLQNRLGDLREMLGNGLYPAVMRLVDTINAHYPQIERLMTYFAYGCSLIIDGISWVVDDASQAFEWVEQNWDIISTVLITGAMAIAGAMVYSAVSSAVAWAILNPELLLIAGSVLLVIYLAREMGATWADICGFVGGVLYELYAFGYNMTANTWNYLVMFAEFFANFLNDPIAATAHLIADWADWVLSVVQSLASAIDAVFGSNLAGAVNGWRSNLQGWVDSTFGENQIKIQRMEKIQYDDAWNRGTQMGRSVGGWIDDFSISDFVNNMNSMGGSNFSYDSLNAASGINSALEDIGADTKAIRNSVALSEEDIRLLVDMATREYVNNINLTSQTPIINVNGQNTGDTEWDRQQLADTLKDILLEQSASGTTLAYT